MATRHTKNRDRPLSVVTEMLGFTAPCAFSGWFRAKFGSSVSTWRAGHAATVETSAGR
jgi:AraC-like DNA-binding protein